MFLCKQSWRWYGPDDPVSLSDIRQAGATDIVHALHHIPNGEVWSVEEIRKRQRTIADAGLVWSVVESVPVHEHIKTQTGDFRKYIDNYKQSIRNLAECGIHCITYNFMPVLDWARTELEYPNADGTSNLYFNRAEFAYFDCHILGRKDARCDYDAATLERMDALAEGMDEEGRRRLVDTIIVKTQGFVNGNISEDDLKPVEKFRELLALYDGITRDDLRANMKYFLEAIMPVCRKWDINMCVHPDDPPLQILGLPRIVTCDEDIEWFLNAVPDPHNGLTFCAGSLSAGAHNDVPALARKYASRTHFVHARICNVLPNGDFKESTHLDPRLIDVVRTFERVNPALPMRVDHAPLMLGDHKMGYNAGYSFHGRMLALGMVSGIMAAVNTEK